MRLAALAFAALLPLAPPAAAQTETAAMAAEAAAQLAEARAALDAAEGAQDRVRALTQTVTAYEEGLEALRSGLRRAAIREAALRGRFEAERAELSSLLGVLMTIQSTPDAVTLLNPVGPVGTARSAMLIADVAPALRGEVDELRAQLDEIAALQIIQQSAAETLTLGLTGVQQARAELSQAIASRSDLPERLLANPAQLDRLLQSADTLQGFADGLGALALAGAAPDMPDLSEAMGALPLPVHGTILRRAGESDAAGIRRPGWLIATRPLALVTAPWPATIRYAGPLLDYGNVMILEPGSDVLIVLAGLDRVYGDTGQVIPAGAPVGTMGGSAPDSGTLLTEISQGGGAPATETLYLEVRQGGKPVDPADWFAEQEDESR